MPKRPERFNEVIGHTNYLEYFLNHINKDTLPQFIIIDGDEGLGKTTIAKLLALGVCCTGNDTRPCYDCESCKEITRQVIQNNKNTDNVRLFNMSIDGGKDAAKEVVANLTLGLSSSKSKVIILDEAHAMTEAAQDAFLVDTEYLPKGVHMILATTNTFNLSATLKSRAITVHLNRLKQADIMSILRKEVFERKLNIQGGEATLSLIATWAEGKPRIALNLLNGFSPESSVSSAMIKEFIGYMELDDILPLVQDLGGSMTHGLTYISEMKLNSSIVDIMTEILKIKKDQASYKLSMDDARKVRLAVVKVKEESIVKFIYEMAALPKLSKSGVIAAFMRAHESFDRLFKEDSEVLLEEMSQKSSIAPPEMPQQRRAAPTMEALLRSGSIVEGG